MSNCVFAAGRSLIDLVASRLALGAPALRAVAALTQPNRVFGAMPVSRLPPTRQRRGRWSGEWAEAPAIPAE
jgi:hypothetical protein